MVGIERYEEMVEAKRRIVYATIIKNHLEKFERDCALDYIVKADYEGVHNDPIAFVVKLDCVRKIQRFILFHMHIKLLRKKYPLKTIGPRRSFL